MSPTPGSGSQAPSTVTSTANGQGRGDFTAGGRSWLATNITHSAALRICSELLVIAQRFWVSPMFNLCPFVARDNGKEVMHAQPSNACGVKGLRHCYSPALKDALEGRLGRSRSQLQILPRVINYELQT